MFCYIGLIRALLTRPHIPLQKKYRTVGLAVVTMVNFGICFGPYNISHVVGFVQQRSLSGGPTLCSSPPSALRSTPSSSISPPVQCGGRSVGWRGQFGTQYVGFGVGVGTGNEPQPGGGYGVNEVLVIGVGLMG